MWSGCAGSDRIGPLVGRQQWKVFRHFWPSLCQTMGKIKLSDWCAARMLFA